LMANEKENKNYTSVFPNHRIGISVQFKNGVYTTSKRHEQELIESDPYFGTKIFASDSADPMRPKVEPGQR